MTPPTSAQIQAGYVFAHHFRDPVKKAYARAYYRWLVGTQEICPTCPRTIEFKEGQKIRLTLARIIEGRDQSRNQTDAA